MAVAILFGNLALIVVGSLLYFNLLLVQTNFWPVLWALVISLSLFPLKWKIVSLIENNGLYHLIRSTGSWMLHKLDIFLGMMRSWPQLS